MRSFLDRARFAILAIVITASFFASFLTVFLDWRVTLALVAGLGFFALTGRFFPKKVPRGPMIVLFIIALVSWPFCIVLSLFGEFNFNAFIAHYVQGIAGFTLADVFVPALEVGTNLGVFCLGMIALASNLGSIMVIRLAAVALFAMNPIVLESIRGVLAPDLDFPIADLLQDPVPVETIGESPDILLVFLEGTERSFGDIAAYEKAYQPLQDLASEGIEFTGVQQLFGTDWTMAGVVAATCGLPHAIPLKELSLKRPQEQAQFGAFGCLTDHLKARDYDMATLIGADVTFAGHESFFKLHGVEKNFGRDDIKQHLGDAVYDKHQFGWGVDDWAITTTAAKIFSDLGQNGRPRFMMTATLGPHGVEGFLSSDCASGKTALVSRDIAKVLDCSITQVVTFVRQIQAMARPNGLKIILLSDHLNHAPAIDTLIDPTLRRNTVIFLGSGKGVTIERQGTMVDVYPTLLDWLGIAQSPVAAGLGRSLFSDQENLADKADMSIYDRALPYDPTLWAAMMARRNEAKLRP